MGRRADHDGGRDPEWRLANIEFVYLVAVFLLPIALRLALLPHHPPPMPAGADDFSYLLLGDTFAHFRLANPPHPMSRFFETLFVVQEPTYSSQYAPGQGLMLALGQLVFGNPWAGLLLSGGLLSALCYWMLLGWTTRGWALVGALMAACQFGPSSMWTNYYFGGLLAGAAGALVFGSLPRFRQRRQARHAASSASGSASLRWCVRTKPCSGAQRARVSPLFRAVPEDIHCRRALCRTRVAFILLHNSAVTGRWTTFPYMLHQYYYGTATTFFFQRIPVPHRALTAEHAMIYKHESALHGTGPDTFRRFAGRFLRRLNTYRFYFLPALIVPLLALLTRLRDRDVQWLIATILLFMLGTNLYPYFLSHYVRGPHERVRAVERHGAAIAAQMEALDGLPRARRMLRPVSGMAFICPATSGS